MAESENQTGFDCEFLKKPQQQFQTQCPICLLVLREPYQATCCGKSFCRSCIGRVKALNSSCPHCNEAKFTDFPNKGLQQSLYQMKVRCTHKRSGCRWTGELGTLDSHLNLDPQPAYQLEGCDLVMVKCTRCSETHQRQKINHHQTTVCSKRPFTCEHCKDYDSTFENVTTNHWPVCEYYPVECPNRCHSGTFTVTVLQRQNIKSHVANDCPLTEIKCEFHYVGCEVKLPRKDMKTHLRVELVTHMSMMAKHDCNSTVFEMSLSDEDIEEHLLAASYYQQLQKENRDIVNLKQRVTKREKSPAKLKTVPSTLKQKFPVDFTMHNFEKLKTKNEDWYSPPFYTHHRGYKLCLRCSASGLRNAKGNHISILIYRMRGEFDDELNWTFRGEATVQLLRQDGSYHSKTMILNCEHCYSRVTAKDEDRGVGGEGDYKFISHGDCYKHCVKNDSLHFRIASLKLSDISYQ